MHIAIFVWHKLTQVLDQVPKYLGTSKSHSLGLGGALWPNSAVQVDLQGASILHVIFIHKISDIYLEPQRTGQHIFDQRLSQSLNSCKGCPRLKAAFNIPR